ncbi:MAG TPA: glycosyltransferase [Gemmatimonadaceae bacterium]|nr:glycosyltransferase [Gemmatimonadaceae bacterium]
MARCLFLVSDRAWTGRARALVSAARGLAARGHPVFVAAPPGSAALDHAATGPGGPQAIGIPRNGGAGTARMRAVRRLLADHAVDVVFVHSDTDHLLVALAMVALSQRPTLVRRISLGERLRPTRVGGLADRLAPVTQLLTGRAGVERAVDEVPRFKVELGVPLPPESAIRTGTAAPLLACVYDAAATMHASRVLRAVTMLRKRHRELSLCMIASGEVPERLRMQAAALGLSRVVRWIHARGSVNETLAQSAALIVAAGGDEAIFATLDGMAYGVPVVAPRASLFERYVANGISGILLDRFDAPACAAALATLVSDSERRVAMGNVARSRVARDFAESGYVDGLEEVLRTLAPGTPEPVAGVA